MFKYFTDTLENGLRLVFVPTRSPSVFFQVSVGAGSKYEQGKEAGLAHFLEHMAFKGTKKRPDTLAIAKELDGIGAFYNAGTGKEMTSYWIHATVKDLELTFDILSDILANSVYKSENIKRERGVILEEMNLYEDTPSSKIYKLIDKLLLGNNGLGRPIIGSKETVQNLQRKDFFQFKSKWYLANNMVLAVVGGIKEKSWPRIIRLANRFFGSFLQEKFSLPVVEAKSASKIIAFEKRSVKQSHFVIGWPSLSYHHPGRQVAKILQQILTGGMSSMLYQELVDKRGWAYYVHGSRAAYQETGKFLIASGVKTEKLEDAISLIRDEVFNLDGKITGEWLRRAKRAYLGKFLISLENSGTLADWVCDNWLLGGEIEPIKTKIEKIKAAKIEQLKKLAKTIFVPERTRIAVISSRRPKINLK